MSDQAGTRPFQRIVLEDGRLPVRPQVAAACELLGMDPLYVANEGKVIAIVPPEHADALLDRMRSHPLGKDAAHPGVVVSKTDIGGTRVVSMQVGEQIPRIC